MYVTSIWKNFGGEAIVHPQLISTGSAELYFGEVRKANEKKIV